MAETTGQLTLPTTTDGRMPAGMKTKISGAGQRITRPHALGDTVVLVLEGKIKSAGHEETNDGVLYVEAIATKDLFELDGDLGKPVLAALRQAARSADGEVPLAGMGTGPIEEAVNAIVDGSGVVMTDAEVARARGEELDAASDTDEQVVLVFEDGTRGLWPDDWSGLGQTRAVLGGVMRRPGSETVGDVAKVVEYVDHVTGESIATWTPVEDDPEYQAAVAEEQRLAEEHAILEKADLDAELDAGRGYRVIIDGEETPDTATLTLEQAAEVVFELHSDKATSVIRWGGDAWYSMAADGLPADPEFDVDVDPQDEPAPAGEAGPFDPPDGEVEFTEDDDGFAEPVTPDNVTPIRPDEPVADGDDLPDLPAPDDFLFVDRQINVMKPEVNSLTDRPRLLRLIKAEEQGRGRGLKPRKGVLDVLTKRAAELYSNLADVDAPDLADADLEGFDVPDDAETDSFDPEV